MDLGIRIGLKATGKIQVNGRNLFLILSALLLVLTLQDTGTSETAKSSNSLLAKAPDALSEETIAIHSPFGLLDPIIDTPTMNNFEYYKNLGIKWIEFSRENALLGWQSIEKEKGKYVFTKHDEEICGIYKQGINIIYVTRPINSLYGTKWVEGPFSKNNEFPEGRLKEWGDFIRALVERYDGDGLNDAQCSKTIKIRYYQLVHELVPSAIGSDFWRENAEKYAEIFEKTYTAMNQSCINCTLVMPVPPIEEMKDDDNFLAKVLARLKNKGINNIGFDYHHWGDYKTRLQYIRKIKEYAIKNNFNLSVLKIFSNESGTPSFGDAEIDQAGYVIRSYVSSIAHGQTKQFWTRVFDYSGGGPLWMHMGLVRNPIIEGASYKKLAYFTYKKMVETLEGSDWGNVNIISENEGLYIYKFIKNNRHVWVAWNDNSDKKEIYVTGITSAKVKVTETVPNYNSGRNIREYKNAFKETTMEVKNGMIKLLLGNKPVFIE